jgi:hypothetical protein
MTKFWLYLPITFLIQEQFSIDAILVQARQNHIAAGLILLAWIIFTAIDIYLAYALGTWVRGKIKDTKLNARIETSAQKIEKKIGSRNEALIVFFLGVLNFPYINAFLYAWLDVRYAQMFVLTLVGNTISFLLIWKAVNLADSAYSSGSYAGLLGIIITVVASTILLNFVFKKMTKD